MKQRAAKISIPQADAFALRYSGFLGHRFCGLYTSSSGARATRVEANSAEDAWRTLDEHDSACSPAVYEQIRRGVWRAVPR